MGSFAYVYILQSELGPEHFYVGLTDDLQDRLRRHNAGEMSHTSRYRPWHIKTAVAFRDRVRASDFERYLKTASGRAFAKKRLGAPAQNENRRAVLVLARRQALPRSLQARGTTSSANA